jgi:cell division septation protein DedD
MTTITTTQAQPAPPRTRPDHPPTQIAARPAAPDAAAAGGRWRIQLGAFGNEGNAHRAWATASGRLPGLRPAYVRAGAFIRVQAGPLRDRAAAQRACAAVGNGCFPVAP